MHCDTLDAFAVCRVPDRVPADPAAPQAEVGGEGAEHGDAVRGVRRPRAYHHVAQGHDARRPQRPQDPADGKR